MCFAWSRVIPELLWIYLSRLIARQYPGCQLVFANGGDRSAPEVVPERGVCEKYNIEMVYGVGGTNKADSSTRINQATGQES